MSEPATAATAAAAASSVLPCIHTVADLERELASLIRVRNRLAQTPDTKLPNILSGLLHRLLVRLDLNTRALYASASTRPHTLDERSVALREQIQMQLTGTIAHAVERIRGSRDMPTFPWMESVLAVLYSMESSVALTLTLTCLQTGLPRYKHASSNSISLNVAPLILCVDQLHGKIRNETQQQPVTKSNQLHSRTAGWLFWNAIALQSGLKAFVDWDTEAWDESASWNDLEEAPAASLGAAEAVARDGSGVMELLLDMLLFWPPASSSRRRERETVDNSTGLSIEGLARINHLSKGSTWNDIYLRQLKYVCLRYAVWPLQQGLLRGPAGLDRSRLLCVLTTSGGSAHGRLAASLLNQCDGTSRLQKRGNNAWKDGVQKASCCCSLSLACSLLILILGDAAAAPVLEQYPEQGALCWEGILGPRPSEHTTPLQRTPLPYTVAARATDYIRDHFRPPASFIATGDGGIRLFVDLVVAVQDPHHHGVYWGIQLIEGLYSQLRAAGVEGTNQWTASFYKRCLQTAGEVLSSMPGTSEGQDSPRREQPQDLPGGVPAPFGHRHDLNHLLSTHRATQNKKHVQSESSVRARTAAYQMSTELSTNAGEDDDSKLSFKLPAILFRCAAIEDETMQPCVTRALEALLQVYIRLALTDTSRIGTNAHHLAAPLLPSLLSAACSESSAARLATTQWCTELLSIMDPAVAYHICRYLVDDLDMSVSTLAKKAIPKLKMLIGDMMMVEKLVCLLDAASTDDFATIREDLSSRIAHVSLEGGISKSASCIALHAYKFSKDEAIAALRSDRSATLKRCGILCRSDPEVAHNMEVDEEGAIITCEICYSDEVAQPEAYAMPCGHAFCRSCWKFYLNTAFESGGGGAMLATCPQHDCGERVVYEDIESVDPELLPRWDNDLIASFVTMDDLYRRCPGPDCQVIAHLSELTSQTVVCEQCSTAWCFQCGNLPHRPAKCDDFDSWNEIFGSSTFWVKKNAKPCPSCSVPIEKSQGCNHMKCTQCGFDFCWLCLAQLQMHMEPHACNRYDQSLNAEDDEERRALFFTERYQAHDEAEDFSRDQVRITAEKAEEIAKKFWFLSEAHYDTLVEAQMTLVKARNFLKHSFIAVWAMRREPVKRGFFESHQATLEMVTERLSQMTIARWDEIYKLQGERALCLHFRSMGFLTLSVQSYIQRILSLESDLK
jgi:ariadne-1